VEELRSGGKVSAYTGRLVNVYKRGKKINFLESLEPRKGHNQPRREKDGRQRVV